MHHVIQFSRRSKLQARHRTFISHSWTTDFTIARDPRSSTPSAKASRTSHRLLVNALVSALRSTYIALFYGFSMTTLISYSTIQQRTYSSSPRLVKASCTRSCTDKPITTDLDLATTGTLHILHNLYPMIRLHPHTSKSIQYSVCNIVFSLILVYFWRIKKLSLFSSHFRI